VTVDLAEVKIPTRGQIDRLQAVMAEMPQLEVKTEHYFSSGMYCRKLLAPAGATMVGKVHKKDHLFMCAAGEVIVWSEHGMVALHPGDVLESKPGTKRAAYAVTDVVLITIHRTDNTDLDTIEEELIEPDLTALYDARNELKLKELT